MTITRLNGATEVTRAPDERDTPSNFAVGHRDLTWVRPRLPDELLNEFRIMLEKYDTRKRLWSTAKVAEATDNLITAALYLGRLSANRRSSDAGEASRGDVAKQ